MFNIDYKEDGNEAIIQGQITYDGYTLCHIKNDICRWSEPSNGIFTYDKTPYKALMYIRDNIGDSEAMEFLEWLVADKSW